MAEEKKITILTDADRNLLKAKSPAVLPDNPSGKGWTATQIKAKFYEASLLLFEWLKLTQSETTNFFELCNKNISSLQTGHDNILNGKAIVKKSYCDEDGNNIKSTYETKEKVKNALESLENELTNGDHPVLSYIKENGQSEEIYKISSRLLNLINSLDTGDKIVNRAENDGNGNNIFSSYIRNSRIALGKNDADESKLISLAIAKSLINDLVNGAGASLDTLRELSEALGNDPNFATTITNLIGEKLSIREAANTYLTKENASNTYSTKEETKVVKNKIDNFTDTWSEIPKISNLGYGRYAITYEEWIGNLGEGRYSFEINV